MDRRPAVATAARRLGGVFVLALAIAARAARAQTGESWPLVADRHMTPAAGAADLLTIQRTLVWLEGRFVPDRFAEKSWPKRLLGIGYRLGKFVALDLPQDHFLMVVAHEIFGHGARLREVGASPIGYRFDWPIPYGPGGGATVFGGDRLVTRADRLGVDTAGIEAQNVVADLVTRRAVSRGALHYREAWFALEARLAGFRYLRSVSPRSGRGHDVAAFLRHFNDGCAPPTCRPVDEAALKRRALLVLADPMVAYAVYGVLISYLVQGRASSSVPLIRLRHAVAYLPALRAELTPYGTEWAAEHTFVRRGRLAQAAVRLGDTGRRRAWGIGLVGTDLVRRRHLRADVTVAVWRQPPLEARVPSPALATGALAKATVAVPLGQTGGVRGRLGLLIEGGYKTSGFMRGEPLRAGPILRAGLTLRIAPSLSGQ